MASNRTKMSAETKQALYEMNARALTAYLEEDARKWEALESKSPPVCPERTAALLRELEALQSPESKQRGWPND